MTIEEKIKYILRKYKDTKYDRAEFMWRYLEEYHGANIYVLKNQFKEFWKDEPSVERKLRDILKEQEFKLEPQQDTKRYEKEASYSKRFKSTLNPKDKSQFERVFGADNYEAEVKKMGQEGIFG